MDIITEKIENMNLVALRKYACAKVNMDKDWAWKCLECPTIEECSCGRRVRDILEDQTKPEVKSQIEKFNARLEKTHLAKHAMTSAPSEKLDINSRFKEALKHDFPTTWLVENGYYSSKESAANQLRTWIKKTGYLTKEELAERDHRTYTTAGKKAGANRTEKARANVVKIFEGTNSDLEKQIALLKYSDPDRLCKVPYNNALRWANVYPDLEEKYRFMDPCRIFGFGKNMTRTVGDMLKELESKNPPENDDITMDEFWDEVDNKPETAIDYSQNPDGNIVQINPEPAPITPDGVQAILQTEFGKKKQKLRKDILELESEIKKLNEKIEQKKSEMDILDKTAVLFGMRPTA